MRGETCRERVRELAGASKAMTPQQKVPYQAMADRINARERRRRYRPLMFWGRYITDWPNFFVNVLLCFCINFYVENKTTGLY